MALQIPLSVQTTTPCTSLTPPLIENATVVAFNATENHPSSGPAYCDVEVYLNHPGSNDSVRIATWLPLTGWNGRYQGTGGGGFFAGLFDLRLPAAIAAGYAAGSTDAGLSAVGDESVWAYMPQLVTNFAHLSVHEMTVVGKAVAEQFYGTPVTYSYWTGCSTGGRQGYSEAQLYPEDYNGIYAIAPALNTEHFATATFWPYVVQTEEGEFVPQCVFESISNAAIAACDLLDGGADGIISNPLICNYTSTDLIGTRPLSCPSTSIQPPITSKQITIYEKIRLGPIDPSTNESLYFGLLPGEPYWGITTNPPNPITESWIRHFVAQSNPTLNLSSAATYTNFPTLLNEAITRWTSLLSTSSPNLTAFSDHGGKLLTWHGWADDIIMPQGTLAYHSSVQSLLGSQYTDSFYRVFMAPAVNHCSGGDGAFPAPDEAVSVLRRWVEEGVAPETLRGTSNSSNSSNRVIERNLCMWPKSLRYKGEGDLDEAESWDCV